jgi:hypothetical protein
MGRLRLLRRGLIRLDKAGGVLMKGEVGLDISLSLSLSQRSLTRLGYVI